MPMPDQVLNCMNTWGKKSKHEGYDNELKILNGTKQKYNWDNDGLDDDEGLVEEASAHPNHCQDSRSGS